MTNIQRDPDTGFLIRTTGSAVGAPMPVPEPLPANQWTDPETGIMTRLSGTPVPPAITPEVDPN